MKDFTALRAQHMMTGRRDVMTIRTWVPEKYRLFDLENNLMFAWNREAGKWEDVDDNSVHCASCDGHSCDDRPQP
jgi:hypothetical protein